MYHVLFIMYSVYNIIYYVYCILYAIYNILYIILCILYYISLHVNYSHIDNK